MPETSTPQSTPSPQTWTLASDGHGRPHITSGVWTGRTLRVVEASAYDSLSSTLKGVERERDEARKELVQRRAQWGVALERAEAAQEASDWWRAKNAESVKQGLEVAAGQRAEAETERERADRGWSSVNDWHVKWLADIQHVTAALDEERERANQMERDADAQAERAKAAEGERDEARAELAQTRETLAEVDKIGAERQDGLVAWREEAARYRRWHSEQVQKKEAAEEKARVLREALETAETLTDSIKASLLRLGDGVKFCAVCGEQLIGKPSMCAEHGPPASQPSEQREGGEAQCEECGGSGSILTPTHEDPWVAEECMACYGTGSPAAAPGAALDDAHREVMGEGMEDAQAVVEEMARRGWQLTYAPASVAKPTEYPEGGGEDWNPVEILEGLPGFVIVTQATDGHTGTGNQPVMHAGLRRQDVLDLLYRLGPPRSTAINNEGR